MEKLKAQINRKGMRKNRPSFSTIDCWKLWRNCWKKSQNASYQQFCGKLIVESWKLVESWIEQNRQHIYYFVITWNKIYLICILWREVYSNSKNRKNRNFVKVFSTYHCWKFFCGKVNFSWNWSNKLQLKTVWKTCWKLFQIFDFLSFQQSCWKLAVESGKLVENFCPNLKHTWKILIFSLSMHI